jgi:hypothetical protein
LEFGDPELRITHQKKTKQWKAPSPLSEIQIVAGGIAWIRAVNLLHYVSIEEPITYRLCNGLFKSSKTHSQRTNMVGKYDRNPTRKQILMELQMSQATIRQFNTMVGNIYEHLQII